MYGITVQMSSATALSLALAYVPAYTDRIGLWTLDGEAIRWIGVVLGAIGGSLRTLPVFVLGRRFSGLSRSRRSTGL